MQIRSIKQKMIKVFKLGTVNGETLSFCQPAAASLLPDELVLQ